MILVFVIIWCYDARLLDEWRGSVHVPLRIGSKISNRIQETAACEKILLAKGVSFCDLLNLLYSTPRTHAEWRKAIVEGCLRRGDPFCYPTLLIDMRGFECCAC